MRARMFKPQFAPLVKSGVKRQTIRPVPKRMPRTGDLESWREWTGRPYYSEQRELAQVRLRSVENIVVEVEGIRWGGVPGQICDQALNSIAQMDGFKDWAELVAWFQAEHGLPFCGVLIKAEDVQ